MATIMGIWGEDKTGKTSLACTAPKPLVLCEIDVGGWDRAKGRFQEEIDKGLITYKAYPMPVQQSLLEEPRRARGRQAPNLSQVGMPILKGYRELWYELMTDLTAAFENPEVKTIVVDTFTLAYEMGRQCYLQQLQENQLDEKGNLPPNIKLRERLQQMEYGEVYSRLRAILYYSKAKGKNLILTHHATDERRMAPNDRGVMESLPTGRRTWEGWSRLGDAADLIVNIHTNRQAVSSVVDGKTMSTVETVPIVKIELCPVWAAVGKTVEWPTFNGVMGYVEALKRVPTNGA